MIVPAPHHFQLTVTDIEKSRAFYGGLLGLHELPRPLFPYPGAWFEFANGQQLHIVQVPNPLWRGTKMMQIYENHFALRVSSFTEAVAMLCAHGYREDVDDSHPFKMVVKRNPPTGYPQVYFLDPDQYLIELNAEALD